MSTHAFTIVPAILQTLHDRQWALSPKGIVIYSADLDENQEVENSVRWWCEKLASTTLLVAYDTPVGRLYGLNSLSDAPQTQETAQ